MKRLALLFFLFILPATFAYTQSLDTLTYAVAFIGGLLMFFSPCSYALVPAYLAMTFRQKTQLIKSTIIFFLGFITIFGFVGIVTSLMGQLINHFSNSLVKISGILFILFAILTLFDVNFSFTKKQKGIKTPFQLYLFGALFATGFAACTGPTLFAIFTLTANLPTLSTFIFVFFYGIGLFVPLFITSYFFDKINFSKLNWIQKTLFSIGEFEIKIWNLIGFLLFFLLGVLFLLYGNTTPVETITSKIVNVGSFSISTLVSDLQRPIIENGVSNLWLLLICLILIGLVLYKNKEKLKKKISRF